VTPGLHVSTPLLQLVRDLCDQLVRERGAAELGEQGRRLPRIEDQHRIAPFPVDEPARECQHRLHLHGLTDGAWGMGSA